MFKQKIIMEELKEFLESWIDINNRDKAKLAEIYAATFNEELKDCPKCQSKAIERLRKHYHLTYEQQSPSDLPGRDYILKPGNHQFVAGDAMHNNQNTTDEQLKWYIEAYPHITPLFDKIPE